MKSFEIDGKYRHCPNGNYWVDVSSIFDKACYIFCDCNKCKGQIYELRPVNVTKRISKESIEKFRNNIKLEKIRSNIDLDNMHEVYKLLKDNK